MVEKITESCINSLMFISDKYISGSKSDFTHWYNLAYSVILTKLKLGADIDTINKFCSNDCLLSAAFLGASKCYSELKDPDNKPVNISQLIASDLNLVYFLIQKLEKEVKYYGSLHNDRKKTQ